MNLDRYHARLRLIGCVVCIALGEPPRQCAELHHAGDVTERSDWAVIPLCHEHHQGPTGIHGMRRRGFFKATTLSDHALLALTNKLFLRELP